MYFYDLKDRNLSEMRLWIAQCDIWIRERKVSVSVLQDSEAAAFNISAMFLIQLGQNILSEINTRKIFNLCQASWIILTFIFIISVC